MLFLINKNFLGLALVTLSLAGCYQKERNCNDFKTGLFQSKQIIDGKEQVATFERMENIQIETYQGKTDTASIRWVNDCEYILEKLHPKNKEESKALNMKILFTEGNTYTFEYGYIGESKRIKGVVTKINK